MALAMKLFNANKSADKDETKLPGCFVLRSKYEVSKNGVGETVITHASGPPTELYYFHNHIYASGLCIRKVLLVVSLEGDREALPTAGRPVSISPDSSSDVLELIFHRGSYAAKVRLAGSIYSGPVTFDLKPSSFKPGGSCIINWGAGASFYHDGKCETKTV
jgi:hypothetical protein